MNKLISKLLLGKFLLAGLLLIVNTITLCQLIRFTHHDPAPIYTTGNPVAMFTRWENGKREQQAQFSCTAFRQSADKGRTNPFTSSSCPENTCIDCAKVCDKDVELGNLHGRWNMIALFYPEENVNTEIIQQLQSNLGITSDDIEKMF